MEVVSGMTLGVCTTDFPRMGCRELFETMARLGFTQTQFSFDSITEANCYADGRLEIPERIEAATVAQVLACSRELGVAVAAVNGTFNAAHPDKAVRAEGVRRFTALADAALALSCRTITLCSGTRNAEDLWAPHQDNDSPDAWRDMIGTLRALCAIAVPRGITLAVETEASNLVDTPQKAAAMLGEVGSPALAMVLDCANLFRPGEAYKKNVRPRMDEAAAAFGARVVLAHAKDIKEGPGVSFCATGEGIVDYPYFYALLRLIGYPGPMMLHGVYSREGLAAASAYLRSLT